MKLTSFITESRNSFFWPRLLALVLLSGSLLLPLLAFDWVTSPQAIVLCPLRAVTGIPCPSCGLTRALAHLERGHWSQALEFHPFSPLLFLLALTLIILLLLELATHQTIIVNPLKNKRSIYYLFITVVIFQVVRTVIFFAHGGWAIFWHENIFARLWALVKMVFC
ncbi:MAG: DUF2752 domain-containing protein [Candidatus Aminicenantes bacterium]|nr:DUF2752 domain-containing protein [Candidatus Aminicenantes bacterium]